MAILYPPKEIIERQKVPPTTGERKLLEFLVDTLDDSYEIFYQPFLNGDQPDIALMRKGSGVLIIEVKDWNLNYYELGTKNEWYLKKEGISIKSPFDQVSNYKDNLFKLHSEILFEKSIKDQRNWATANCMVYFHNASENEILSFLDSGQPNYKYKKFLGYFGIWGSNSLYNDNLNKLLSRFWLNRQSYFFTEDIYLSCKRFLKPPLHQIEEGKKIIYSKVQQDLIVSEERPYRKIKGIAGSGKTLVLAKRAVNAHIRTNSRILILSYNLSLKNYIRDRINDVREEFYWNQFYITNYHQFFKDQANNLNLKIQSIGNWQDSLFFENVKENTQRFDAVFIDEIQDYQQAWLDIITKYFMHDNSEFVVFGDEKQNIYERPLDENNEITVRKIPGNWNKSLNVSHRFGSDIGKLALKFQTVFFHQKYGAEDIKFLSEIDFENRTIEHFNISNGSMLECLEIIYSVLNANGIHSSDVGILGSKVDHLRDLEYILRTNKKEKTAVTFETQEEFEIIKSAKIKQLTGKGIAEDEIHRNILKYIQDDLDKLRRSRKNFFFMKTGSVKLSTIHSFKGWEINTLFLIIDTDEDNNANHELIYTAITRARQNLIILNLGNMVYQSFFQSQIKELGH